MKRSANLLLTDMLGFSDKIVTLLGATGFPEFEKDILLQEATWALIVKFGEAATILMEDYPRLAADFPDIPLVSARRMRNKLIHGYWASDLMIVYMTASNDMPAIRESLEVALQVAANYEEG